VTRTVGPHDGKQTSFLASSADIVIYGGAAGGGKTWGLLVEPLRHSHIPTFTATIFRRTYPQIMQAGGLWDESLKLYEPLGAVPVEGKQRWTFPTGARVEFHHLQLVRDRLKWKGAQLPFIGFDQLEEFEEEQFTYLMTRNRSMIGVRPYIRGTCNPLPDSWLSELLAWWWDEETGYALEERSGVIRWFVRPHDELVWASSRAELEKRFPKLPPKSLTFIPAKLEDNPTLMSEDPDYEAHLLAQPHVERERLHMGNWKIRAESGNTFNRAWWKFLDAAPRTRYTLRYWDKAGTEDGGNFSAGVLMTTDGQGRFFIEDVQRGQWGDLDRENVIRSTAEMDPQKTTIYVEQEPGSGGKDSAKSTVRNLVGFDARIHRVTGEKMSRWRPLAAQVEAGNVYLVRGPWNRAFVDELHQVPKGKYDDQADAAGGAFMQLVRMLPSRAARRAKPVSITKKSAWKGIG
jgi:predicted phage terminase large subunit-like protein